MSRARNLAGFGSAVTNPQNPVNVRLGIVTAIEYYGDGSNLTGTPGGLGTSLLPDDLTSPLNKIYYTDANLTIGSTITVDPPASASAAYTQYTNIVLQGDADLIVGDGDDFIPDILGIGTDVDAPGILANGEGKVRVDNITDKSGVKAPKFPYGLAVSAGAAVSVGYSTEAAPSLVGVDTTTGVFFPSAGNISISNNSSESVRVSGVGSVGVGTTNPQGTVEIQNSTSPILRIGDGTRNVELRGGSTTQNASVGTEYAGSFSIITNNTERLSISTNGNVNVSTGSTLQLGDDSITLNEVYRYEEIAGGAIKKYYVRDTLNTGQLTRFVFTGTDRTSAMITINATGSWTASDTASNHVAAQFMSRVFTNSSGTSSDNATVTTPFAFTYSSGSHYAFNNSGGFGYSIDITNPTGDDGVQFFYEVIIQNAIPSSQHSLVSSTTA